LSQLSKSLHKLKSEGKEAGMPKLERQLDGLVWKLFETGKS
jgi:hypothetical protein